MRRVVITGVGSINPLALNAKKSWDLLLKATSGVRQIKYFDTSRFACTIGATLPEFKISDFISPREIRRMDKFICYGIIAAQEAILDSGWVVNSEEDADRTGVMVGSGIGGLGVIEKTSIELSKSERAKVSPFFIPASLINLLSGHISIKYGFTGPNTALATACASSTHSIGDAFRCISVGDADVIITGGAEAPINEIGVAGFISAQALNCKSNEMPELASRPWDEDRAGFVIGEGAGILVLEEYEHAKKRNAKIYAEIIGYGLTADAHHITAPSGIGGRKAMNNALRNAKINNSDIDYVNAHGTSTPVGDLVELLQVQEVFKENSSIAMSSNKSAIGHLLGAAGAVEAIFAIFALQNNVVPPTLNLHSPVKEAKINLVPLSAQDKKLSYVMSNSFGFGGTNASVIFKKI
ncbi:MAG: beta-ketoacyl-ACP synthase II [Rickettsia sp.]|nr:beta-ketoacyl-ACP synthase II [Rickettsia sp.]